MERMTKKKKEIMKIGMGQNSYEQTFSVLICSHKGQGLA